jgi:outer membrane receptor protein involved in Fe transport
LSLNGAYTDAKLDDDTGPLVGGVKGDQLPFTPKLSVGANVDYEWTVGADTNVYVGGSLRYLEDQTGAFDFAYRTANGHQREIPSYEVLDLRAGVIFGRYSIELYAKNLTDSDGRTSTGSLGTYPNGALGTGVIRPRTIGLAFGFGM